MSYFVGFFCLLPPYRLLRFYLEKKVLLQKMMWGRGGAGALPPPPPPPVSTALYIPTLFVLVSQTPISINKPMIEINLFLFYLT